MSEENLVLYAATYAHGDSARADYDDLKAVKDPTSWSSVRS